MDRFVGRASNLLTSPPARQEQELDHKLQQLRVRGLSHGVTVALGSIKGGVGKTTLTLALADMLADSLRCGVLVVDSDLEWGTAADSTPQDGRRGATLTEVLAAHDQINSPGDLAPYLWRCRAVRSCSPVRPTPRRSSRSSPRTCSGCLSCCAGSSR